MARQQRRKHCDRLGGHYCQQPGPADPGFKTGLFLFYRQGGEDRVDEEQPQAGGGEQKHHGAIDRAKQQQGFAAQNSRRGNFGEEAGAAQMVYQVMED